MKYFVSLVLLAAVASAEYQINEKSYSGEVEVEDYPRPTKKPTYSVPDLGPLPPASYPVPNFPNSWPLPPASRLVPIPQEYPAPFPPGPYPDSENGGSYPPRNYEVKKLKDLRGEKIVEARVRYYTYDNTHYAVISCPRNPTPGAYTWILVDSKKEILPFNVPGTVALTGGINVDYLAKYGTKGKWEGKDLTNDKKHRFRRVGCLHGNTMSYIQH